MFAGIGFSQPMDMEFGPDGSLYVVEYGGGFFTVGPNVGLYRIDYVKGRHRPDIRITTDKDSGPGAARGALRRLHLDRPGRRRADLRVGLRRQRHDGRRHGRSRPTRSPTAKVYQAKLTVTDATNRSSTQTVMITVGNTRPKIEVEGPVPGGFYEWRDTVDYKIKVTDPEDGTVDCNQVNLNIGLGHDDHSHPIGQNLGCSGAVVTDVIPEGHSPNSRIFYVLRASYTDNSAPGSGPLEGSRGDRAAARSSGRPSSTTSRRASSRRRPARRAPASASAR